MQFEYTPPQTSIEQALGGFRCINAFGPIQAGDDERFLEFLSRTQVPPRTSVYIDSPGGDVEAAMTIGRTIRDHWFSTHIGQYVLDHNADGEFIKKRLLLSGQCMSAATLVFLGGRLRYLADDAKFGVHQFSFRNPTPDHVVRSQILSAKIARYVSDMGVSSEFLELSSATLSNAIDIVPEETLLDLRVVTGGQTPVEWSIQAIDNVLYVRGERDNLYGHHKMLLGFAKPAGFFIHAVIESQGREKELTEFPLVELVIGETEHTIIDLSARCARAVEGIYTNISSDLTKQEAEQVACSDAFGIRVRGGPDAELFLGVGTMSTEGGATKLRSFFHNLN
ncbi:hypothetical protein [Ensifer sp. ENS10]|uniref:COG3904 family protein n=1 Tax=Ensifer sp. ENS10 TaxID=2769286 RepID=UPI002812751F|nr:hypothetical protein [Ensifer sp. ENS10]